MRRFPHQLTENRTTDLPQYFLVVDTETEGKEQISEGTIHKLKIGCAIWFTLKQGKKKRDQREIFFFDTIDQFWNWFEKKWRSHMRIIVSAHNLAFDFMILDSLAQLKKRNLTMDFPIVTGVRFIGKAKREGLSLWFIDTMNYAPTSLKVLGDSLGIEKLEMPKGDQSLEEWKIYCQRDTEILETFWKRLLDFLRSNNLGAFGQTAASLSFNSYRHRFMDVPIFIHAENSVLKLERSAYYGGRTECFQLGDFSNSRFYLLDINSMYPFVMQDNLYPCRLIGTRNLLPLQEAKRMINEYALIAFVGLDTPIPVYPKRIDGKLVFPVGRYETYLSQNELRFALEHGHVRYIRQTAIYEKGYLFKGFIGFFYRERLRFKEEKNPAFSMFSKLIMNSLYGKFGQRGHKREIFKEDSSKILGYEQMYSRSLKQFYNIYYWDGKGYIEREEGEAFNSFPAISACVTGNARVYLWGLIEKAGLENVYYCDTDSLICNYAGFDHLRTETDTIELGKLKLEAIASTLSIRGLKDYKLGNKEHIKGVSSNAHMLSSGIFEYIHFATMRESIRKGKTEGILLSTAHKELKRNYDKGLVDSSGLVSPFVLKEF